MDILVILSELLLKNMFPFSASGDYMGLGFPATSNNI
jgi:hypothetical protein